MTTARSWRSRGESPHGSARRSGVWGLLLAVPTAWLVALFVSGLVVVALLSFGRTQSDGSPVFGHTLANYRALGDPIYLELLLRSLGYAVATTLLSALIGYPVAYVLALYGGRLRHLLMAAIVVPFFASYLIRIYAWSALLSDEGVVNRFLGDLGLGGVRLLNSPWAVIGGLVYGYVVYMILPLYAALERLDRSLIEAGKDLYHGPVRTFWSVTLPATRAGLAGGVLLVFLPALGDFVSAQLLGGPRTFMIGNLVQQQFTEGQDWPLGSALTMALLVASSVIAIAYLRSTSTGGGQR